MTSSGDRAVTMEEPGWIISKLRLPWDTTAGSVMHLCQKVCIKWGKPNQRNELPCLLRCEGNSLVRLGSAGRPQGGGDTRLGQICRALLNSWESGEGDSQDRKVQGADCPRTWFRPARAVRRQRRADFRGILMLVAPDHQVEEAFQHLVCHGIATYPVDPL